MQIQTAYHNILDIRNKCEDYSLLKPLKIPSLAWKVPTLTTFDEFYYEKIPYLKTFRDSSFDGDRRLAELVIEKLTNDPRLQNEDVYRELNEDLEATMDRLTAKKGAMEVLIRDKNDLISTIILVLLFIIYYGYSFIRKKKIIFFLLIHLVFLV